MRGRPSSLVSKRSGRPDLRGSGQPATDQGDLIRGTAYLDCEPLDCELHLHLQRTELRREDDFPIRERNGIARAGEAGRQRRGALPSTSPTRPAAIGSPPLRFSAVDCMEDPTMAFRYPARGFRSRAS